MTASVTIIGVSGLPEIEPGADLARLIVTAAKAQGTPLAQGDILVVTQKVVSKAEGRTVDLSGVDPSPLAEACARDGAKDPRLVEVALREARRVVRMDRGVLITETHHGLTCANSGVDTSNIPGSTVVALLPEDPDASAERLRKGVLTLTGHDCPVVISDTFGRPWREGLVNVAIGVSGMNPLADYVGRVDAHGKVLNVSELAVADELASAAELVMGKLDGVPAAVVRNYPYPAGEGGARRLLRDPGRDLFR